MVRLRPDQTSYEQLASSKLAIIFTSYVEVKLQGLF